VRKIAEANHLTSARLTVGQELIIPGEENAVQAPVYPDPNYQVKAGETVESIAEKYWPRLMIEGKLAKAIREMKQMNAPGTVDSVSAGQWIYLPKDKLRKWGREVEATGGKPKNYKVKAGETTSSLLQKYWPRKGPRKALKEFRLINVPTDVQNVVPGDMERIPDKKLRKFGR
jgi:LysM repeat protein